MDLRPLLRRDFRLLYAAQAVSFLGTMVTYVALPWQMYTLTRSSLAVGVLGVVELVPLLVTAFVGGALADWMDRRRLVIATEIGLMAGCLALMANAARPAPSVAVLYVAAALMSALSGLQKPSLEAMTPRLVPPDELPAVAALSMLRGSLGMIVGPAIGGVLVGTAGAVAAFGRRRGDLPGLARLLRGDAIGAAARRRRGADLAIDRRRLPLRAQPPGADRDLRHRLRGDGLRHAAGAVPGARGDAVRRPRALGLLYAAPAVGALIASLTSRWTPRVHRHGFAVMVAATVWGVAIVAFGFAPSLWPALACLAIAGGADAVSGIFRMTMWNQTIPDALRGRLAGIEMVSYMSGPLLGHAEAGAVAALAGVQASIVSGGLLCVVGVVACGLALPHFRRYDARTLAPPPPPC